MILGSLKSFILSLESIKSIPTSFKKNTVDFIVTVYKQEFEKNYQHHYVFFIDLSLCKKVLNEQCVPIEQMHLGLKWLNEHLGYNVHYATE